MSKKSLLIISGISGAMCVMLGAIGAHALQNKIPAENLHTLETAVKYQFYHTLALIFTVILHEKTQPKFLNYSTSLFTAGIFLFCFSLYFLSLRPLMGIGNEEMKWVGAITPFGGISFILAWLMFSISALKSKY